jgi:hypothetical protein
VLVLQGGLFEGREVADRVVALEDGTFDGGDDFDSIDGCVESPPAVYVNVEEVAISPCSD